MGQTAEHGAPQARQTGFTPRHGALDRDSTQNALSAPRGAADLAQGSDDADLTQSTATACMCTCTASCIQHMAHCSVLCVHPFWQMFLAVCTHSCYSVLCAAATAATAAAAAVAVSLQGQIHQGADTDGEKQGCPRLTAPKRSAELFLQSERLARQYYPDDNNPNNALRCEWGPCCVAGGGG